MRLYPCMVETCILIVDYDEYLYERSSTLVFVLAFPT